jgi:DNA-3-methyladenine glycosylase II
MAKQYFKYGIEELTLLKSKDKKLATVIDEIGMPKREVIPDLFSALVNSIIGQQISNKAHLTIWGRLNDKVKDLSPSTIIALSDNELQSIGVSFKKVGYIKNIAQKVLDKELIIDKLYTLSDDEVCEELVKLKGIGKWTAEMIMIFSMQRKNILSFGDLAIVRGMRMLYHHREIKQEKFNKYHRRYSPYASIVSFYLWAIASGEIPGMKDYAPKIKKAKTA